jgi:hypothetical protein
MLRLALVLAALAAPCSAGDCPVAEDLAAGIVLTRTSGIVQTWTADPSDPDLVRMAEAQGGDEYLRLVLRHGIYLESEAWSGMDWRPIVTVFAQRPPLPAPDSDLTLPTIVSDPGSEPAEEEVSVSYGPVEEIGIGACVFAAIPATVTYPAYAERQYYLPELRISVILYDQAAPWQDSDPPVAITRAGP